jgi:Restriction endonuclease NotI
MAEKRNLVEIFGYSPDDITKDARLLWKMGACPFIGGPCTKYNHDQTVIYGTCSVTSPLGDIIICPNRLYADKYETLRRVARDAYGSLPFVMYKEYIDKRGEVNECIVALGQKSGREVKLGQKLSMDWVLAHVKDGNLIDYTGVEIQSIDITGNYRDSWHAYSRFTEESIGKPLPSSGHGLNWANVHKRLIPQIIRKGVVYSRSNLVTKGLFFIVSDIVYQKFEQVVGSDIPTVENASKDTITVHTYELGPRVAPGMQRSLQPVRQIRFLLSDFSERFISGPTLPQGEELDKAVRNVLGLSN